MADLNAFSDDVLLHVVNKAVIEILFSKAVFFYVISISPIVGALSILAEHA